MPEELINGFKVGDPVIWFEGGPSPAESIPVYGVVTHVSRSDLKYVTIHALDDFYQTVDFKFLTLITEEEFASAQVLDA